MRTNNKLLQSAAWLVAIVTIAAGAWLTRSQWQPLLTKANSTDDAPVQSAPAIPAKERTTLELNQQARANLGLKTKPVSLKTYWQKIVIPGEVVDRPGVTDRGITSPLEGVVTTVHAFEGDMVRPGDKLFSLRLVSEPLQQAQSELYKAIRETEIVRTEKDRIAKLIQSGVVPGKRMIELEQKVSRQAALIDAHEQDLTARGLSADQIAQIKQGKFLSTIEIVAPMPEKIEGTKDVAATDGFFEVQQLKVDLGHQVQAGSVLAILANHESLYVKGHAFRKEASKLARAAESDWPIDVEFVDDVAEDWEATPQRFQIRHLANTTDPNSRTFDFFVALTNQPRTYQREGRTFVVWRYRPGQRVRISVPVEEIDNAIVVPAAGVFQQGPEAFVFQQNGDLFNRIQVKILHQDRSNIVIANDGSVSPGFYLAQNAAASLNRILKSQASSGGLPPGFHVHADGTVHGAH